MTNDAPIIEHMTVPTSSGGRIFVQRDNGRLFIRGECSEEDLDRVVERIRTGRWRSGESDMPNGTEFDSIGIGIQFLKNEEDARINPVWVPWESKYFNFVEVRGDARSGRTDLIRSMMFEMRNFSHVHMIDPDGIGSKGLPIRIWQLGEKEPHGVGLFIPYGRKQITRDDTEKNLQLAIDFLKAALDLSAGQEKLLRQCLGELYDNYWIEVDKGAQGRPKLPNLEMLIREVEKAKGTPMMTLHNNLSRLRRYGNVFDRPMPTEYIAGAFIYPDLPRKLQDLLTYLLLNKLASAPFKTVLMVEGTSIPWYKVDRRNDVFTGIVRDAPAGSLFLCYTINQHDPRPKLMKMYEDRLMSIQLRYTPGINTQQKYKVINVGTGIISGQTSSRQGGFRKVFHVRIPSLDERVDASMNAPGLSDTGSSQPSTENDYENGRTRAYENDAFETLLEGTTDD